MKVIIYTLLIISILTNMSCKTSKIAFDPETSEKEFLTFGSGGGFTGQVMKYYLISDGTLYVKDNEVIAKVGKAPKQMTEQVFLNYEKLGLNQLSINDPGNKYSFIEMKKAEHSNTIKWGKNPLENKNINTYFTILMNIVKKIKPTETL